MPATNRDRAVVLGGSIAGLIAARVLADAYQRVTIVERDVLPTYHDHRRGVPHGRHVHGLIPRGRMLLEELMPGLSDELGSAAEELGLRVANELGVVGVLAVELFETPRGLLVNELAMRPHNSGHWTIEGATTSQFEQHLRAVLDLPLGAPGAVAPQVVMANVFGGADPGVYARYLHVMAADPGVKIHMYGKAVRPGRKIGHVTVAGDDLAELRARAGRAARYLAAGKE